MKLYMDRDEHKLLAVECEMVSKLQQQGFRKEVFFEIDWTDNTLLAAMKASIPSRVGRVQVKVQHLRIREEWERYSSFQPIIDSLRKVFTLGDLLQINWRYPALASYLNQLKIFGEVRH